jgi:lysozyme family protein
MRANWERSLALIFRHEGGYSDHPSDPGGATNLGITRAVLAEWRGRPVTKAEVKALTKAEAAKIYEAKYWVPAACDRLPTGLDLAVFDCAVNQGLGRAVKLLQTAARVKVDGKIGPITLDAVKPELLGEFMALRMTAYGILNELFPVFGLGWSRRLMLTMQNAVIMQGEERDT